MHPEPSPRELCDALHPFGRCTCGQAGECAWCSTTCALCGAAHHDGPCEDFDDLGPVCRLCFCSKGAACLVDGPEGPDGPVVDCTIDERLGACSACLESRPLNQYLWRHELLTHLRARTFQLAWLERRS